MSGSRPFGSAAVARTFDAHPPAMRRKLLALRALIFKTAAATDGVGEIESKVPADAPSFCIAAALTYHRKNSRS